MTVGSTVRFVLKAAVCLIFSWMLVMLTLGYVVHYFRVSLPIGLLAIPVAFGMFALFSTIERRAAK